MAALLPYLDAHWREQVAVRGIDGLESVMWKPWLPISCRPDWRPATGKPGESLALLRAQALDPFGTSVAVCNPLWGAPALPSEDMAIALCRAMNDWIAREWLDARAAAARLHRRAAAGAGPGGGGDRAPGRRTGASCPCCCRR